MDKNPSWVNTRSKCPFHHVVEQSNQIRTRCNEIFWKPTLKNNNIIWGVNGAIFADFIENFAEKRIQNIELVNPWEMQSMKILWFSQDDEYLFQEMMWQFMDNTRWKKLSKLARVLYTKFINENIWKINRDNILDSFYFSGFSLTFMQAFDSIFITGLKYAKTRDDWESIKKSLWRVVLNLAKIPTNIQEWITSSSDRIWYMFWENEAYLLEHMEELFLIQERDIWLQRAHRDTFEKIVIDWGYGICPALEDEVMKKSFYALHKIYGKVFFNS